MAAAATTTTTFQRTPTLHLPLTPNRFTSYSKFSSASFQRSRQSWPTQLPLMSSNSSISPSYKLSRLPVGFFFCSASSHDETLVTEDEKGVATEEFQSQPEDTEDATVEVDSSESDGSEVEESPASILASLQSYKEALADNNESKIAEIESHLKSIEDEKLVLERQVATLSDELSTAKDRVLRISADFDNFRKRTERERVTLVANAQGEVVESLLAVLDNFERAKAQIKVEGEKEEKINNSYQSIYKQFVEILGSLGVVSVETTGQPFDPLLHEAIMREESTEYEEGVVIQEFRKGFRIGERLLRPSMVKVSAGPGPGNTESVGPSEPEGQAPEEEEEVQSESSAAQEE
ncbi:uncharacterized protein LOC111917086 isoform X1 [Lactuca sativa]|uniref:GrpE protein homolog n=1 Tax=Lactuca sativa TaxID=4236 RepID=A0A9R1UV39_LACSA|nr:uncharacterized protein LOC111917086 isoform X1 [Lactuca sativa]KAJ0194326.1 hypothetical protein LSAT_V11C800422860 [Lactuca sativa]